MDDPAWCLGINAGPILLALDSTAVLKRVFDLLRPPASLVSQWSCPYFLVLLYILCWQLDWGPISDIFTWLAESEPDFENIKYIE